MSDTYFLEGGTSPLLVSIPHAGILLSPGLEKRLTPEAAALPDTDWFVDRLYAQATGLGAGLIRARYSRYVADLNRPPDDSALYRQATPGLVPLKTFLGKPVYRGAEPGAGEIAERLETFWWPYHRALESELARLRAKFGFAVLLDAHSIRSRVPGLFEGRLPDLNLGTNDGRSASSGLIGGITRFLASQRQYSHVVDGRFKGGYITRRHGRPGEDQHALQLEMSQSVYMQEDPPRYNEAMAAKVKTMLSRLLGRLADWEPRDA